jgi:adenosylcobyric acid synthase
VAVLRFPRISNFTDFRLLDGARWVADPVAEKFDCVILPGTKNTIGDLEWLRSRGLDRWILEQKESGALILGVCGGYQMMGERIEDPHGAECEAARAEGLNLLPVRTVLAREKTTRVVEAMTPAGAQFRAYEIHMGQTERPAGCQPFAYLAGGDEGIREGRCLGTYLHGALEDERVLSELLGTPVRTAEAKQVHYDRLADWFERHADLRLFEELYL